MDMQWLVIQIYRNTCILCISIFFKVGDSNLFNNANQDDFKVAQRLYASFYNLYSAIPAKLNWSPDSQFYGLSPAGLAYGALRQEYYNTTSTVVSPNRQYSEGNGGHIMYHQDFSVRFFKEKQFF